MIYYRTYPSWRDLLFNNKKKDEEEPTLVTESILAEIMAEAQEDVERAVQPDVPYKLVNGDYDMVIKAIPVKAITSEQRVMFNDQEANCK